MNHYFQETCSIGQTYTPRVGVSRCSYSQLYEPNHDQMTLYFPKASIATKSLAQSTVSGHMPLRLLVNAIMADFRAANMIQNHSNVAMIASLYTTILYVSNFVYSLLYQFCHAKMMSYILLTSIVANAEPKVL